MAKSIFVKKILNILLAIMLCSSLLLFSACSQGDDEDNKPVLKIVYRPYATSKPFESLDDTYIDLAYQNILDLSDNILTEIVSQYGMGEIGNLISPKHPSTNGRDYEKMFGVNLLTSPLMTNAKIGEDMGKMAKVSYDHGNKMLILSSHGEDPNILEIVTEVVKAVTPGLTSDLLTIVGSLGSGTTLFRIDTTTSVQYIFYGGNGLIMNGENTQEMSYLAYEVGNQLDFSNTKTYLSHILGGNFGVIEKDYIGVDNLADGDTVALNFQHWNYSVAEGDIENGLPTSGDGTIIPTGKPYLDKYIEKYGKVFAVEVAKALLVGGGELPNDVKCPDDLLSGDKKIEHTNGIVKLNDLYKSAKNGNDDAKLKFIWAASAFIDHLGLTKNDIKCLEEQIKKVVIGEEKYDFTDDKLDRNEDGDAKSPTNLNNNYDKYLFEIGKNSISAFQNSLNQNITKPILEWLSFENSSSVEDLQIDGYLQSIILMSEGEIDVDYFRAEPVKEDAEIIDYVFMIRSSSEDGEKVKEINYPDVNNSLINENLEINFQERDEQEDFLYVETTKLSGKQDVLVENKGSCLALGVLNEDLYKVFKTDDEKFVYEAEIFYHGWYFSWKTNFIELVFASKNVFSLTKINFNQCSFSYLET